MRKLTVFIVIMLLPVLVKAQDIQLKDCLRESMLSNPLSANKGLANQIAAVKKEIIRSAWLPGFDLNAQATWQSDVVTLNLDLPFPVTLPKIPRDQYKVTGDITQLIYEGGSIRNQQIIEDINADLSVKELEKKELDLRQMVEDLYFAILVTEKKSEVLQLMVKSLNETVLQVESGVKNGILSETDLLVILAEQIKLEQQLISVAALKQRAVSALGILMGKEIGTLAHFLVPDVVETNSPEATRPEIHLFALQNKMLEARKDLLSSQLRPKVMAFGQAGYGKPGLNFMGDKWDPYLVLGIKGTWNVWDWGRVRKQKSSLTLGQTVVNNQQESFSRQIDRASQNQLLVIQEISDLLQMDEELVRNRKQVTAGYQSKLANGMITASQFLNEWTREQEARINQEVRKIELVSSKYKLLLINGK